MSKFIKWDFRFSRRRVWRSQSSGILQRVDLKLTDVSEVLTVSIIALMMEAVSTSESCRLRNYTAQYPRTLPSSWKSLIDWSIDWFEAGWSEVTCGCTRIRKLLWGSEYELKTLSRCSPRIIEEPGGSSTLTTPWPKLQPAIFRIKMSFVSFRLS
jgi:hypothetical protein